MASLMDQLLPMHGPLPLAPPVQAQFQAPWGYLAQLLQPVQPVMPMPGYQPQFNAGYGGAVPNGGAALSPQEYQPIFAEASRRYGVPQNLLEAVARAESDFRPNLTSSAGARGIMQLMPATAREVGVTDVWNPQQNIYGGAQYLKKMMDRFGGNTTLALAAYNAGPGNVQKYGGVPPFRETQNYVRKIMGRLGQ